MLEAIYALQHHAGIIYRACPNWMQAPIRTCAGDFGCLYNKIPFLAETASYCDLGKGVGWGGGGGGGGGGEESIDVI